MEYPIKYKINEDFGIEIPKEMRFMTFQGFFTFLRKTLQIKYTRRIHIDSILKKCKGKFFKAVNDCLKQCVKINLKKLPQTYITNISIEYNKQFLDFTINDLYNYFNLSPYPMETILQKDYCVKGKESFFKYIFLSKIKNLYSIYIQSKRYKRELESMKRQKGIKMVYLHQFVAENFISYYCYSKPHIKKNKNIEARNNVKDNNNNNINNNNINNINNINNNNINNNINNNMIDYNNINNNNINYNNINNNNNNYNNNINNNKINYININNNNNSINNNKINLINNNNYNNINNNINNNNNNYNNNINNINNGHNSRNDKITSEKQEKEINVYNKDNKHHGDVKEIKKQYFQVEKPA